MSKKNNPFIMEIKDSQGDIKIEGYGLQSIEESGQIEQKSQHEMDEHSLSTTLLKKYINTTWMNFLWIGVFVMFVIFAARLFYLQIYKTENYRALAETNRLDVERIQPRRGTFFDRWGTKLVTNQPHFSIAITPGLLPADPEKKKIIVNNLSRILKVPAELTIAEIFDPKKTRTNQFIFREGITQDQAISLALVEEGMQGVSLIAESAREYSAAKSLSHILGYTGRINESEWKDITENDRDYAYIESIGKSGLELAYEDNLRGKVGKKYTVRDALGKKQEIVIEEQTQSGNDLILTVDSELQSRVYEEFLTLPHDTRGAAIVLDVETGAVRALVSFPGFDSTSFASGLSVQEYESVINNPLLPLFNRAISAEYPTGSTIKPLVSLAALQEGIISKNTKYLSSGGIKINEWFFPDWKAGGHGQTDVVKAIAESVNTFFYIVGGGYEDIEGLGVDRLKTYYSYYGLGRPLGIDIAGESSGFIPTKAWKKTTKNERWYIGDTYNLAIGQGDLLATPLQVASFTSAIAGGGRLMKPYLVEEIRDDKGTILFQHKPIIISHPNINEQHFDTVRSGMRAAVTSGSAKLLSTLPFEVAGKTGTAQVGGDKESHAWFTAFAPFERPEIALAIIVENGGEGSRVAAPMANNILYWYAQNRLHKQE